MIKYFVAYKVFRDGETSSRTFNKIVERDEPIETDDDITELESDLVSNFCQGADIISLSVLSS